MVDFIGTGGERKMWKSPVALSTIKLAGIELDLCFSQSIQLRELRQRLAETSLNRLKKEEPTNRENMLAVS
jgi:hypothetical protein